MKLETVGDKYIIIAPTELATSLPDLIWSCWAVRRTKGERQGTPLLLPLLQPSFSHKQQPGPSSFQEQGRREGNNTIQKQSRETWLLSLHFLIVVQVLPLPISLMNRISCRSLEVNHRTEDRGTGEGNRICVLHVPQQHQILEFCYYLELQTFRILIMISI